MKTLVVIPLYNHGASVARVAEQALATGLPLLVVDDGSTDEGLQAVRHLACHTLRFARNRGKGAAILAGADFAAAHDFEVIITLDADGQHDPADLPLLMAKAQEHWPAVVIGARQMVQDTVPGASHFGRAFSNFWVRLECGADLPDTQSGFRLYPVAMLHFFSWSRRRYDFEVEVLVRASWAGVRLTSVDVSVHYPPPHERISHFHKGLDNLRLSLLHSRLVLRRLLPMSCRQMLPGPKAARQKVVMGNPWQAFKKICQEHISPLWLALAVWLGIFMGALPILTCHTVAVIYVAHRLHLNKVVAVAASNLCMPPVVPVLCIQTGYFLWHGEFLLDFTWEKWLLEGHYRLLDWLVGSLILGPLLGLIGGAVIYLVARYTRCLRPQGSPAEP
ncbi:MAG: DUF2062 domain-containing protein [Desulfurivibrionaceae bacterium]|nr:DUF2062 domain-containing protein [Desulfurivibrionaceae bacterium]